jgi:4-amino-4-deoxy-L-arabinose transferase-like glycosyltransferase
MPTTASRTDASSWQVRVAALAALGGALILTNRAAFATSAFDNGWRGDALSWTDVGSSLLLVLVGWALFQPWAAAHLGERSVPRALRWWSQLARRVYPMWWAAVIAGLAIVKPGASPRQVLGSFVLFRDPRSVGPLPGTGIGWILFVGLGAALLVPLWSSVIRVEPRPDPAARFRREVMGIAALMLIGVLWRVLCVLAKEVSVSGALSQLPGQLVPLGTGMLVAVVAAAQAEEAVCAVMPRWCHGLLAHRGRTLGISAAVLIGGAVAIGAPSALDAGGIWQNVIRHLAQTVAAAGLVIAAILQRRDEGEAETLTETAHLGRLATAMATVALGLVLFGEPLLDLVIRQYRERVTSIGTTRLLSGPVTPPLVWTLILAAATGVVLTCALSLLPRYRTAARTLVLPFTLGLAGVVSGAFLWRFIALIGIAPERTDGGDPFFYHSTANLLAEGRGFPEPLNWIAYGKSIPSAIHGPLYPMVLSISSRFGGHTYFDHKMVSLLIGTATVLVVGLVAKRLGGQQVAIVAAVLAAFYPNLWTIDTLLFPEGLFALLTTLVILVAYRWRDQHRIWQAVVLGGLIGLAALARGEGIFLGAVLAMPWMLRDRELALKDRWRHLVVAGVACIGVLLPWMIRNAREFEVFVPLSTNGQELLVYANCDETYSGKFLGFWLFDCQDQIRAEIGGEPAGDEAQKAKFWGDRGRQYAADHASQLPKVVAARIGRQWELFRPIQNTEFAPIEGRSAGWAKVGLAYYYALAGLSVAGALALRRRGIGLLPLVAQLISVTVTAAYAYGNTRFRASAEPVLCILAAVALAPLLATSLARWRRAAATSAEVSDQGESAFVAGGSGALISLRSWRNWAELACLGVIVGLPLRGMYLSSGATMEEGFMLTFPERVLAGDVPNVDFLHLYGPGSLHALAGVYQIFGVDLFVQRTYGLAQHIGIILGIYVLLRAWGRLAALGAAAVATVLVLAPIGLSALAWNGAVALGLWSVIFALRARTDGTKRPAACWAVAGLLSGLTLTYRPDLVVALALAHAFVLWRSGPGAFKRFVAGAVAGLLPFIIHFAIAGPSAVINGMFLDPVRYLRPGRALPQPPSWDHFDGALQVIADKFPPWWKIPHLPGPQQLFWWFFALPAVAIGVLVIGVVLRRRSLPATPHRHRLDILVASGAFGFGLLPQAFQRPDSAHLAWVSCVCFPVAIAAIIELVGARRPSSLPLYRVLVGIAAVGVSMLAIFPYFSYRPYLAYTRQSLGNIPQAGLKVERNGRAFYLGDTRPRDAANEVIADLDALSKPGERLLVGPVDLRQTIYSDVFFYYLFPELTPATYYIEMDPGLANAEGTRLTGDVESADWLILTRYWSGWIEPNTSTVFGDDKPNQAVENGFCLRGSYQNDVIRLYQRCATPDGIGPYEGPYEPEFDYAVEVSVPVPTRPDGTSPFEPGPFIPFTNR